MHDRPPPEADAPARRRRSTGFEFEILTRLPNLFGATLAVPLLFVFLVRLLPGPGTLEEVSRQTAMADILALAAWLTCWSLLFALTLGCVIVHVMRGPAKFADSYPLPTPEDDEASKKAP